MERMGIYPRWQKPARNLENTSKWLARESSQRIFFENKLAKLEGFIHTANPNPVSATLSLQDLATWYLHQGVAAGLRGQTYVDFLSRAAIYQYWSHRAHYRWLVEARAENPDIPGVSFSKAALAIALQCVLGLVDFADDLAMDTERWPAFWQGEDVNGRFGRYVCKLIADVQVRPTPEFFPNKWDRPIYDELLATWREPNPQALVDPWLAACNWHTHQAREDNNKEYFDFSSEVWYCFPVEILMLMRLREREGLANPTLDHPLMNTPLGKLPPPQPEWHDELLDAVVAKLKTMLPGL